VAVSRATGKPTPPIETKVGGVAAFVGEITAAELARLADTKMDEGPCRGRCVTRAPLRTASAPGHL